jgi:hypothetical protein
MSGKSTFLENALLKLIFNATPIALIADNAAATPLTNLYVSLHTADPTDAGTQTSSEVTAGQDATYARVAVARTSGGWTVTASSVSPAADITFPTTSATGTGCTCTYFGVGELSTGAGALLYSGVISPSIIIPATTAGTIPVLTAASTVTES